MNRDVIMSNVNFRVVEHFLSIQGEGRRAGKPSIFVRVFGCNFECCPGFGMPRGQKSTEVDEIASKIHLYKSIKELPLAKTGCDSYVAVDARFKDFSPEVDGDQLMKMIMDDCNGDPTGIDLVLTGGEPLTRPNQKKWIAWFDENLEIIQEFGYITFETNGSQMLTSEFVTWISNHPEICITLSVSPKLSSSGIDHKKAIKPLVIKQYYELALALDVKDFYLKFVVSNDQDIEEVLSVMDEFGFGGERIEHMRENVYLMPCGGTYEEYDKCSREVAALSMKYRFNLCDRVHLRIFKNSWAT